MVISDLRMLGIVVSGIMFTLGQSLNKLSLLLHGDFTHLVIKGS